MGFLKRWLIKRALKKAGSKGDMEKVSDAVLKDALMELQQTGRTADKILKAKLIRQESSHAMNKIRELDEDFDDEDDEPEQSIEDKLTNSFLEKVISGGLGSAPAPQPQGEITGYDDAGQPIHAETPTTKPEITAEDIALIAKDVDPKTLDQLKRKFLR